jgi:hypothetical protein
MTNASETQGREPFEQRDAAPFFPSEGRFSPVVPLSQVSEAQAASSEAQASSIEAQASSPESAVEPEEHEETTLVPTRASHAHGLSAASVSAERISVAHASAAHAARPKGLAQSWPVTLIAVVLSVVAGLIAGAYLVGSKRAFEVHRPAVNDAAAEQVATEAKVSEAASATTDAPIKPEVREKEADAKPETENEAARAAKDAPSTAAGGARALAAEPAPRHVVNTEPRAERTARAVATEERNSPPAPRLTQQRDAAATSSRRAQVLERRASAPSTPTERTLPVSAPPASSKSRKVIQWP